jgi:hypothetical protein
VTCGRFSRSAVRRSVVRAGVLSTVTMHTSVTARLAVQTAMATARVDAPTTPRTIRLTVSLRGYAMPLGYLFGETSNDPNDPRRRRQPGQFSPAASDAIRLISLRMPSLGGGRPIATEDLLRPQVGGAGGQPGSVASSVLNASGSGPGPSMTPPETAGASAASAFASPAAVPFSTMRPSAGAGETSQLNDLMSNALDAPTPHFSTQQPGEPLPPGYPNPPPPGEPPASPWPGPPPGLEPWLGPNSPNAGLNDVLEWMLRRTPESRDRKV